MDEKNYCKFCKKNLNKSHITKYIECQLCSYHICLECFSHGVEGLSHLNSHSYFVMNNELELFEEGWSCNKELQLLQAVGYYGYGNWGEIASKLNSPPSSLSPSSLSPLHITSRFTPQEIENHYNYYYLSNPQNPLPYLPLNKNFSSRPPPFPYTTNYDPPRPPLHSSVCLEMAGYNASRNDFTVEFMDSAEHLIVDLVEEDEDEENEEEDENEKKEEENSGDVDRNEKKEEKNRGDVDVNEKETIMSQCDKIISKEDILNNRENINKNINISILTNSNNNNDNHNKIDMNTVGDYIPLSRLENNILARKLKVEMIKNYRSVLRERSRRKKKIADFGLINMNKEMIVTKRYEQLIGGEMVERMKHLSQFLSFSQWFFIMESLYLAEKLKKEILKLFEWREKGIKNKEMINIYEKLIQIRNKNNLKPSLFKNVINFINEEKKYKPWIAKKNVFDSLSDHFKTAKKVASPLDLRGTPGFEKLTEEEKQLCSTVRLLPSSYLDYKRILMSECQKQGHLRLAQARVLLKIDVNKTRKIFDFLSNHHMIGCQTSSKKHITE